ncbi:hypothetical protein MMC14_005096 [Varicellaria rhodocarpa]|nr:hypothetical protein [Varicellaria rhodocarpa]
MAPGRNNNQEGYRASDHVSQHDASRQRVNPNACRPGNGGRQPDRRYHRSGPPSPPPSSAPPAPPTPTAPDSSDPVAQMRMLAENAIRIIAENAER